MKQEQCVQYQEGWYFRHDEQICITICVDLIEQDLEDYDDGNNECVSSVYLEIVYRRRNKIKKQLRYNKIVQEWATFQGENIIMIYIQQNDCQPRGRDGIVTMKIVIIVRQILYVINIWMVGLWKKGDVNNYWEIKKQQWRLMNYMMIHQISIVLIIYFNLYLSRWEMQISLWRYINKSYYEEYDLVIISHLMIVKITYYNALMVV